MAEYGYGRIPDVLDGLQFERLLSASGPTKGEVLRPSDHRVPKEVVFIQCCGSRDPELHNAYCSKICCMYTAKHAMLYKHHVPDGQAYVFYIDIRSGGKGYEEFVQRATEEDGVVYLRGKVSKVFQENGKVIVWGVDTLSGKDIQIEADMVVLAMAIRPSRGAAELAKILKISVDKDGFFSEAHPKLRPVESMVSGMFLAGVAQGPKDIPETVSQASGAASKVLAMFSSDELTHDPIVAEVNEEICSGCKLCIPQCPYEARIFDEQKGVVIVNEVLCEGCGACIAACPSGAAQQRNFTDEQILSMVDTILEGEK
jgi:heterodisulfide reductase subunit A